MKNKIYLVIGVVLLAIIGSIFILRPANKLYPAELVTHGHGLAVDVADSSKLYIATHHGLMILMNDKELFRIGKSKDDYMGFSPHPTNPNIFYSSGHPSIGGNLGFQISEDAGFTWKRVSKGIDGPVDFHAMAVSPANPNVIYGWYANSLQRSLDNGKTWELISNNLLDLAKGSGIYNLVADPKDENTVYAGTGLGLFISKDKGLFWSILSEELADVAIMSFAINPQDPSKMLSFTPKFGFAKSVNSGLAWEKIDEDFDKDIIYYIAYDKNNPSSIYILTKKNSIYKSSDAGNTWSRLE